MLSMGVMLQELSLKLFLKPWRLSFVRSPSCIEVVYSSRLSKYILFCGFLNFLHGLRRENPSTSSLEELLRISNIANVIRLT